MKKLITICAVVTIVNVAHANLVYNLVSPTNGYAVTGTVTTNGKIGLLEESDIVEWSFMINASNGRSFTANSSETDASIVVRGVIASATSITVAYPPDYHSSQNALSFRVMTLQNWALPWKALSYLTGYSPAGGQGPTAQYSNYIQGSDKHAETNDRYISFQQSNIYWSEPPATPFLVATAIPEPASLLLLALGGVFLKRYR